jgi:hypothetical protein
VRRARGALGCDRAGADAAAHVLARGLRGRVLGARGPRGAGGALGVSAGRSGANAGQMLGAGVYVTTSLKKAMNYAREGGAVFRLKVDLGRCLKLESDLDMRSWQGRFDSAWAPAGLFGEREENCVRDPRRVRVEDVLLVAPAEAARGHWRVVDRRLRC